MDNFELEDLTEDIKDDLIRAVKQQINSEETLYVRTIYNELIKKGYSEEDILDKIAEQLQEIIEKMVDKDVEFDEEGYKEKLTSLI
ncbi:MAG: hypothetical protein GX287_00070 [Fusobacteria bacterium]|nr:hypothetical protein [Fusobacteriota bacterium]